MNAFRSLCVATALAGSLTSLCLAQTPPSSDTTSPSSASSPHQRDITKTPAAEAPAGGNGANPAAASTPHQEEVTGGSKTSSKQNMKDCIVREQADHTGMSAADAKKACKAQLKSNPQQ
jgi:hypothetical protein